MTRLVELKITEVILGLCKDLTRVTLRNLLVNKFSRNQPKEWDHTKKIIDLLLLMGYGKKIKQISEEKH